MTQVLCFDFDGVICDSAPETALTAWNASRELWPKDGAELPPDLQLRFCRLRPVIHTGYEAVPLMRLIEEDKENDESILAGFPVLRDGVMEREGLDPGQLKRLFAHHRDRLIEQDQEGWLRSNPFYPGIGDMLAGMIGRHPVRIVTTKGERFAALLLRHNGIALPDEQIFGLERNRSKPEILAGFLALPEFAGAVFHFIEDRMDTLDTVAAHPVLDSLRLYLADWGYNTPPQRQRAAESSRIEVISLEDPGSLRAL